MVNRSGSVRGGLALLVAVGACSKGADPASAPAAPVAPVIDAAPGAAIAPTVSAREVWSATIVLPTQLRDLVITFAPAADGWTATMDIPELSVTGIALVDVALGPEAITFTIPKPKAPKESWERYSLTRAPGAGAARGLGHIGNVTLPIRMVRLADGEAPRSAIPRPQTPRPPFPYAAREVTIDAPDGGKLAGTLTIPAGAGPFPAMLLLSGSGQQDRDETIFGHKPYFIIADRLSRNGFAVLRMDDRGTGKTVGAVGSLDTEIADGGAAIAFLKAQPEIDPARIGIMGHSVGGMVAPNVAVATHGVAFIVSLAGPSVSGAELVPLQLEITGALTHAPAEALAEQVEMQRRIGAAVGKGEAAIKATFVELFTAPMAKALGRAPTPAELDQAIAPRLKAVLEPWTLSFFKLDPRVAWRQLTVPVLLIIGDKDTQVPADINIKTLEETLAPAARALLTAKKLPGLNHLFQHAQTGLVDEYALSEETFDPSALDLITSWLVAQAARPAR